MYLEADSEENENFLAELVTELVEGCEVCFVSLERCWEGLLGFSVKKLADVEGSGRD